MIENKSVLYADVFSCVCIIYAYVFYAYVLIMRKYSLVSRKSMRSYTLIQVFKRQPPYECTCLPRTQPDLYKSTTRQLHVKEMCKYNLANVNKQKCSELKKITQLQSDIPAK